jgi:hypothetical protein
VQSLRGTGYFFMLFEKKVPVPFPPREVVTPLRSKNGSIYLYSSFHNASRTSEV